MSVTEQNDGIDARDEELVHLLASGRSTAEVAVALNCSLATIYRRLRRPRVRAALVSARLERWRPVADELRGGVLVAVRRLLHLVEHGRESTQVKAAVAVASLALKCDDLIDNKLLAALVNEQLAGLEPQGEDDE